MLVQLYDSVNQITRDYKDALTVVKVLLLFTRNTRCICGEQGSHKLWKSWKTWKVTKKSMHGKNMEFEKNLNNHGKIMEFCEII